MRSATRNAPDYSAAIGYDAAVQTPQKRIVVGLSSDVLEAHDAGTRPDGIGVYTRELELALSGLDIDVRRVGATRLHAPRVRPHDAPLSFPVPLRYMAAAASALRWRIPLPSDIARAIDVYHATDYVVPRLAQKPVVATLYDAIPLAHPEWANPRLRRLKNWLLRRMAQGADRVIAISVAGAEELVEHYRIPQDRIRVVPLGVNEQWFEAPPPDVVESVLDRFRLRRGFVLHVGTLQPRKNVDALVSAYERLPRSVRDARQLVLVGKYGWATPSLRARLEAAKPQGRIVWVDYVERDALRALYHAAGMFVFPSLAEGFGLPILEAFACGLPVIASELPALREVAGPDAIWVDPRRADVIADAIAALHAAGSDTARAARNRERARRFGWRHCAERTLDVYRELL